MLVKGAIGVFMHPAITWTNVDPDFVVIWLHEAPWVNSTDNTSSPKWFFHFSFMRTSKTTYRAYALRFIFLGFFSGIVEELPLHQGMTTGKEWIFIRNPQNLIVFPIDYINDYTSP